MSVSFYPFEGLLELLEKSSVVFYENAQEKKGTKTKFPSCKRIAYSVFFTLK